MPVSSFQCRKSPSSPALATGTAYELEANRYSSNCSGIHERYRRHRADVQLQRKPHRYRRTPFSAKATARDAVVVQYSSQAGKPAADDTRKTMTWILRRRRLWKHSSIPQNCRLQIANCKAVILQFAICNQKFRRTRKRRSSDAQRPRLNIYYHKNFFRTPSVSRSRLREGSHPQHRAHWVQLHQSRHFRCKETYLDAFFINRFGADSMKPSSGLHRKGGECPAIDPRRLGRTAHQGLSLKRAVTHAIKDLLWRFPSAAGT